MVVAPALVDLGVLLALGVLIGISFAYRYSFGVLIVSLAQLIGSIRLPSFIGGGRVLGFAADELLKVDNAIRHALGRGIEDMQAAWNEAVSWTAYAVHWTGKEIASLAHDTAQAVEGLHVTSVTNVYRRASPGIAARVGALAAAVATLRHQLVREASRVAHLAQAKAVAVQHAIAVPDVGAIPKAIPRLLHLEHETTALEKWIKAHAPALTVTAITGLLTAAMFRRLGLGWLRCKGVGRVGRSLCGLSGLIETLYAGAITAFAVTDLCRFSYGIERTAEAIRPIMLDFVDVENALFKCSSASFPSDFPLAAFSPTPVYDAVAL